MSRDTTICPTCCETITWPAEECGACAEREEQTAPALVEAARALLARIDDRLPMGEASKLVNQTNCLRAALEAEEARQAHGFEAGAEWMREQAARAVESTEEYSFSVAVKMAPSDHLACAVSRIRSLPTSPPAPEEDK